MKKIILSLLFLVGIYFASNHFFPSQKSTTVGFNDLDEASVQKILSSRETTVNKQINPSHTLIGLDGTEKALASFSGKPLVVMFFASWCKACEMQLPKMIEQQALLPNTQFVYIAVSSKDADLIKLNQTFNNQMAIYRKGWGSDKSVLSGTSLPLTFIINEQGKIVTERQGFSLSEGVEFIQHALGETSTNNL